jgi:programmed cell death 6-interacting protein
VSSLAYEKVCVLYNIAAMQSQVGAQARIADSDEELKSAAKMFQVWKQFTIHFLKLMGYFILQNSSGIFAYLKTIAAGTMGGQEPTPDLSADTATALAALMLAQAQEIFVTKAIVDKMKDGIVAKLCVQCEDMYADALKQLQRDTVKHLWEKDWIPTVCFLPIL